MRTRQSPYEIVATVALRVVPATASFYSARGIGSQASAGVDVDEELRRSGQTCCWHRASGFQASKSVGFRWGILPAVHVCYKLFWNWNGVVRSVSQDKGFVIWQFHEYCLVQIVSLWSLRIGVQSFSQPVCVALFYQTGIVTWYTE